MMQVLANAHFKDLEEHISKCRICSIRRQKRVVPPFICKQVPGASFYKIGMDFLGPVEIVL